MLIYRDDCTQIYYQKTIGEKVDPHWHHVFEMFIEVKTGEVDFYLPGESHQREKDEVAISIKVPLPETGDLQEITQEEHDRSQVERSQRGDQRLGPIYFGRDMLFFIPKRKAP